GHFGPDPLVQPILRALARASSQPRPLDSSGVNLPEWLLYLPCNVAGKSDSGASDITAAVHAAVKLCRSESTEIVMKRASFAIASALTFAATAAQAADMALKAAAAPAPVCTWCGWYVGANVGGTWSNDPINVVTTPVTAFGGN